MRLSAGIVCFLVVIGWAGGAVAARIDVPQDYATLQAAIDAAVDGDEIVIACGEYAEEGITCGKHVTIRSESRDPDCVRINGFGYETILTYGSAIPGPFVLEGITFSNAIRDTVGATQYAGALFLNSSASIIHCAFVACSAVLGGAVFVFDGDALLENCVFLDNKAFVGSSFYSDGARSVLRSCTFMNNYADHGQVAHSGPGVIGSDPFRLEIVDCEFRRNSGEYESAIYTTGHVEVLIESSVIVDNFCHWDGGSAIAFSTFSDLELMPSSLRIVDTTFARNLDEEGTNSSVVSLDLSDASGHSASIEHSIIASNRGTAIEHVGSKTALITCSDIWGNAGGDWVGGIEGQFGVDGNISTRPLFCDLSDGDYRLAANSPCAPAAGCGMGAFGVGCPDADTTLHSVPGEYPTVGDALAQAIAGDTVILAPNTYHEHGLVMRAGVTLRSETGLPDHTKIIGDHTGRLLSCIGDEPGTRIQGVSFINGQASEGGGVRCETPDLIMTNCDIIGNVAVPGGAWSGGGGLYVTNCDAVLDGCLIWQNEAMGITDGSGGGVKAMYSTLNVTDCRFLSNRADTGGAIYFFSGGEAAFSGSTFYGNGKSGIIEGAVLFYYGQTNPTFIDCTIGGSVGHTGVDLIGYALNGEGGVFVLESCILAGGSGASFEPIERHALTPSISCTNIIDYGSGNWIGTYAHLADQNGNLSVDPLFHGESSGDMRLEPGSPCLDTPNCGTLGAWKLPAGTPVPAPASVAVGYGPDGNTINWGAATRDMSVSYRIYRSDDPGFVPQPADLLVEVAAPPWLDDEGTYQDYYRVTAVNVWEEESGASAPGETTGTGDSTPSCVVLLGAHPNPFNPSMTITYSLPSEMGVSLDVYTVLGQRVRTLLVGRQTAGRHSVLWDGRDAAGQTVASGVYLYRLTTADGVFSGKVALLK